MRDLPSSSKIIPVLIALILIQMAHMVRIEMERGMELVFPNPQPAPPMPSRIWQGTAEISISLVQQPHAEVQECPKESLHD
jgi:hypothetical protein